MVIVKVKENENIENALKRFKRKCNNIGVIKECRRRQQYNPPSVLRRQKQLHAEYVNKLHLAEETL